MRRFEEMDERTAREYLERYVASLPELRERFARRLAVTGGPVVDTSVESLADLDPWYEREIQDPTPDGLDGMPLWWDAGMPGPRRVISSSDSWTTSAPTSRRCCRRRCRAPHGWCASNLAARVPAVTTARR